jgi:hypothetical protein
VRRLARVLFWRRRRPVDEQTAAWLESSLLRLHQCCAWPQWVERVPIVPTDDYYPVKASADRRAALEIFTLTCKYMNVPEAQVKLRIMHKEEEPIDLGADRKTRGGLAYLEGHRKRGRVVAIRPELLRRPLLLVAAISHELAHVVLQDCKALRHDERSDELLTDLMTVYAGMGIFTANAAFSFDTRVVGSGHAWSVERVGYLTEPQFGYALAVFAAMRGEVQPSWVGFLDPNVREFYDSSLRSLSDERRARLAAAGSK